VFTDRNGHGVPVTAADLGVILRAAAKPAP
jgi:hypothetical protein